MQKFKKIISIVTIASLLVAGISRVTTETAKAAMTDAKDTLSTSVPNANATHTVVFTTAEALEVGEYFEVSMANMGGIIPGSPTCPAGMTGSRQSVNTVARCTSDAGTAAGTYTITIADVPNPGTEGSQLVPIASKEVGGTVIESTTVRVAIINSVSMTATVPATLEFVISPLDSGVDVNGTATTAQSATTTIAFGNLSDSTARIMGQQLKVTTNADDGFTVTVQQNQDLTSGGSSIIDPFDEGTVAAPKTWEAPVPVLDSVNTYGHMGLTSNDATLTGDADTFGDNLWRGFDGTTPVEVMYHNGPADGGTANKGEVKVAYQVQVSALQEAGDYVNTLTYICTPQF